MKHKLYLLLACWLLALGAAQGQTAAPTVRVSVMLTPPYSTHLADYIDQPGRMLVSVSNLGRSPVDLQLAGNASSDGGVQIFTKPSFRSPRPVTLQPLETRQLSQDELRDLFDAGSLTYVGIKAEDIARGAGVPEGTYTICVRALDYTSHAPLSADAPGGCSRPILLRSLEPPYVLKPAADEVIKATQPQNIIFAWNRPAGAPPTTEYTLRIIEPSSNSRNINDAFLSGTTPPFFETTVQGAPSFLYGPGEPALVLGRRYVFAVTAYDPQGRTAFRNGGRSEVQSFVYGSTAQPAPTPLLIVKSGVVPIRTSLVHIPTVVIRGTVRWGWRKEEEASSLTLAGMLPSHYASGTTLGTGTGSSGSALTGLLDPSAGPAAGAALTTYLQTTGNKPASSTSSATGGLMQATVASTLAGVNTTLLHQTTVVLGGGTTTGVSSGGFAGTTVVGSIKTPSVNLALLVPSLPPYMGQRRYPLASHSVYLMFDYKPTTASAEQHALVGTGTTDADGNFAIRIMSLLDVPPPGAGRVTLSTDGKPQYIANGKTYPISRLRVEVRDGHFFEESIPCFVTHPADSDFSIGEMLVMANSYRLNATVKGAGNVLLNSWNLRVLRRSAWYQAHGYARPEGMLPEDNRPIDYPLVSLGGGIGTGIGKTLTIKSPLLNGQVAVTDHTNPLEPMGRLFTSYSGGADDEYVVTVKAPDYYPLTTTLSAWPAGDYKAGLVQVSQSYTLQPMPPQVLGRVLRLHDSAPVPNASVRLRPTSGSGAVYNTKTDPEGRFTLTAQASTADYTLEVLPSQAVGTGWTQANVHLKSGTGRTLEFDPILVDVVQYPVAGRVVSDEAGAPGVAGASLRWAAGGAPFAADADGRFLDVHPAGLDTLIITKLGFQPLHVPVTVKATAASGGSGGGSGGSSGSSNGSGSGNFIVVGMTLSSPGATAVTTQLGTFLSQTASLHTVGNTFQLPGAAVSNPASGSSGGNASLVTGYVPSSSQYLGGVVTSPAALLQYLQSRAGEDAAISGSGQDLGTFILHKLVGRLRVTVRDSASKQVLAGATVSFPDATPALSQTTGADGKTYFDHGPGGLASLLVTGPTGTVAYVPALPEVTIATNGSTTELTVLLAPGARVRGTVVAGGAPVAGALVRVLGRPDLTALTAANGSYEVAGVPQGTWTLEATKQGLVGQSVTRALPRNQITTVNFTLTNAGFAIDKLLGFPIEVKKLTVGADTTLTGAFVNLTGNPVFSLKPGQRLEFANVAVRVGADGVAHPKGQNFVLTDQTELLLKAFNFLPVKVADSGGLRVQMQGNNPQKGQLVGAVEIDFSFLGNGLGWAFEQGSHTYLSDVPGVGAPAPPLPVLTSDGGLPYAATSLKIRVPTPALSVKLYGFTAVLDVPHSSVGADGLHLAGSVKLDGIPGLSATTIGVSNLWISTTASIKTATLGLTPPLQAGVGGFGFTFSGGSLTEQGFQLNGSVQVQPPGSALTQVSFSDLLISNKQLYGGSFVLPAAGLDVFKVAKFMPVAGKPLSFGTLPGTSISFFSGGAKITLPLIDQTLTVQSFTVRSDGKFAAQVPTNLTVGFGGIASLTVTSFAFNTIGGVSIAVGADVKLTLPLVQAEVGNITYRPGQSPTLENLGLHIPIGVGELGGSVSFHNGGFGGSLALNVVEVLNVQADFDYGKLSGKVYFNANIKANIPPVLIGPGLFFSGLTGGIKYANNTLQEVRVGGVISLGGFSASLALNPVQVTVKAGPVIIGSADLTVFNAKLANATITLDFPNSLASVQIKTDFNPLPAVGTATAGGIVVVSGKSGDTYWCMGVGAKAKLLGLLDVQANILVGQNLNVDKHPELSFYTSFIDRNTLTNHNTVNGAHLKGSSHFGRHADNPFSACFWEACGSIWYYNDADAFLNANFASGIYGIGISDGWGGGASLTIAGAHIAGADVGASGGLGGSYSNSNGWNFNGTIGAHLVGWIGDCSNACTNKICWGGCFNACIFGCEICPIPVGIKVCVHPGLNVGYSSNSGVSVGLDL